MAGLPRRYTDLLGIEYPIVQEGLGPYKTAKLAAAVSNAGGLGTVSMPGFPEDLKAGADIFRAHIEECASLTDKPFAVNIPVGVDKNGEVLAFTDIYIRTVLEQIKSDSHIARRLTVLTTSAGFPGDYGRMIRDAGLIHQHKVGSTRNAIKAAESGVDVILAAGFEMGGHAPSKAVHSFVLLPNITEAVDVPVLLTGGVRDARGLAAAISMGAVGVAMGTRFILSEENSEWHPRYIQALLDAQEGDDVAFNGVYGPCRGLRNKASENFAHNLGDVGMQDEVQQKIALMQRAQSEGDIEDGLVLMGQVAAGIKDIVKVSEFVPAMAREAARLIAAAADA